MPIRRRAARRAGRRTARRRGAVAPRPRSRAVRGGRRRRPVAGILALAGTAAVAYKLGKKNTQEIEQYTGQPVDTLSDEQLAAAMDELNIEVPEDDAQTGDQYGNAAYDEAPADEPDYIDELERLANLKEKGIISEEDFQAKKAQLLGL